MKLPQDLRKLISTAEAELAQREKIQAAIASTEAELAQLQDERNGAMAQIAEVEAMRALGETTAEAPSLAMFDGRNSMLSVRIHGLQARLKVSNDNLRDMDHSIAQRAESFWRDEIAKLAAEWREAAERLTGCVARIAAFNSLTGYGRLPTEEEARLANPANSDETVNARESFYDDSLPGWRTPAWCDVPAAVSLTKDIEPLTEIRQRLSKRNEPTVIRREPIDQPTAEQSSEERDEKLRARGWSIFGSAA